MTGVALAAKPPARSPAARPLRALHVIDALGVGGAETWLMALLRFWGEDGPVRNDFLATGGRPGVFDAEAAALGANIHYLRFGRDNLPAFARGFRRILAGGGYDVLHDHQGHASGWHYLTAHGRLPPVRVTHVHNPAYQIRDNHGVTARRRLAGRLGKRLAAGYATHILGTSREAITGYGFDDPAFDRIPKAALHCGFDAARFAASAEARAEVRAAFGWPADARIVLFAGRFDASPEFGHPQNHKNSGFAVRLAIDCARRCQRVRFIFAGEASAATAALRASVEAAGLGERIAFAGVRRDIGRLMGGADALLFPSRAEGLGMVAVEAQAAGLPVLASSSVPRECVVVPGLVRFLGLEAGAEAWLSALLAMLAAPRPDPASANRQVAASPFAIAQSARKLAALYRTGALT